MILLTPGPCMTSEAVRLAGAVPDLNHRDPRYLTLIREVKDGLRELAPGFTPYLLGGSGTAAMEAMAGSLIQDGPILLLSDGYYSQRMREIFNVLQIPCEVLEFDWMKGWDLDQIAAALNSGRYEAVVMTHHETTTGRLNPVETVAEIAKGKGTKAFVDAMSSLGADALDFSLLDAVCASANKCLHGLPGVSFVLSREPAPERTPRSYYLHLPRYEGDKPPLTPPVPALLSFHQAMQEFAAQGGQTQRLARYQKLNSLVRRGLEEKGYPLPVLSEKGSCSLVMAPLPVGSSFEAFFDHCFSHGYVIYGCKGPYAETMFQVSVMGELEEAHILGWLSVVPRWRG